MLLGDSSATAELRTEFEHSLSAASLLALLFLMVLFLST